MGPEREDDCAKMAWFVLTEVEQVSATSYLKELNLLSSNSVDLGIMAEIILLENAFKKAKEKFPDGKVALDKWKFWEKAFLNAKYDSPDIQTKL